MKKKIPLYRYYHDNDDHQKKSHKSSLLSLSIQICNVLINRENYLNIFFHH